MGVKEGRVVLEAASHYRYMALPGNLNLCKLCQQKLVRTFPFVRLQSHYTVLGISPSATQKEVRDAYIKLSKKEHPDQNKSNKDSHERFVKINEAYAVLSKDSSRREYDTKLKYQQTYSYGHPGPGFTQHGYNPNGPRTYNEHYYGGGFHNYGGGAGPHGFNSSRSNKYSYYGEAEHPFGANFERRREYAERTMKDADNMKTVKMFNTVFKIFSAVLVAFVIYEVLGVLNMLFSQKIRQWNAKKVEMQKKREREEMIRNSAKMASDSKST